LDDGCGDGHFLASVGSQLKHKRLVGIDVSMPPLSKSHQGIEFISLYPYLEKGKVVNLMELHYRVEFAQ